MSIITHYVTLCLICRRGLDVDEVLVDAAADWKPVEKSPDLKDEDGIHTDHYTTCVVLIIYHRFSDG